MKLKKLFGFIFAAAASVMLLAACTTTEAPEITPAPATSTPAPAEQTKSLEELTQDKHYAEITVNVNGEDYYVYLLTDASSVSDFRLNFN